MVSLSPLSNSGFLAPPLSADCANRPRETRGRSRSRFFQRVGRLFLTGFPLSDVSINGQSLGEFNVRRIGQTAVLTRSSAIIGRYSSSPLRAANSLTILTIRRQRLQVTSSGLSVTGTSSRTSKLIGRVAPQATRVLFKHRCVTIIWYVA